MHPRIKNPQDFWSGIVFMALGALAMYLSRDYPMGNALQPGPGYFPTWLGGILMGFGAVIGAVSLKRQGDGDSGGEVVLRDWGLRPWLVLPVTLAIFALLM